MCVLCRSAYLCVAEALSTRIHVRRNIGVETRREDRNKQLKEQQKEANDVTRLISLREKKLNEDFFFFFFSEKEERDGEKGEKRVYESY